MTSHTRAEERQTDTSTSDDELERELKATWDANRGDSYCLLMREAWLLIALRRESDGVEVADRAQRVWQQKRADSPSPYAGSVFWDPWLARGAVALAEGNWSRAKRCVRTILIDFPEHDEAGALSELALQAEGQLRPNRLFHFTRDPERDLAEFDLRKYALCRVSEYKLPKQPPPSRKHRQCEHLPTSGKISLVRISSIDPAFLREERGAEWSEWAAFVCPDCAHTIQQEIGERRESPEPRSRPDAWSVSPAAAEQYARIRGYGFDDNSFLRALRELGEVAKGAVYECRVGQYRELWRVATEPPMRIVISYKQTPDWTTPTLEWVGTGDAPAEFWR